MTEEEKIRLTCAEHVIKSVAGWVGIATFSTALYLALIHGAVVHISVYFLGGVFLGIGRAIEIFKGVDS